MRIPVLATTAVAALAVFAPAAAAQAVDYVPEGPCATVSGAPAAGAAIGISYQDGVFGPGEQVGFLATGSGTVLIDGAPASPIGIEKAASPTGSASIEVTLPTPASGSYTVTGVGMTSQRFCTVALAVPVLDAAPAGTSGPPAIVPGLAPAPAPAANEVTASVPRAATDTESDGASRLAETGYDTPFLVLWAASGAVLLGLALTAAITITRRNRAAALRPSARHRA